MRLYERYPKTVLTVCVILLGVIIDAGGGLLLIPADYESYREPHPVYHHGLKKGFAGRSRWGTALIDYHTNSLGFRDASVRRVLRKPARGRTLLMGDSFTEGRGVPYEKTFAGIMAAAMAERGHEVMNAAVSSYSPLLYYLKTKHLVETEELTFDRMICLVDMSDVQDEVLYASFQSGKDRGRAFTAYRIKKFLRAHSLSWYLLSRQTGGDRPFIEHDRGIFPEMEAGYRQWSSPAFMAGRGRWTADGRIITDWGVGGLDLSFRNMKRLADLCQARSVRLAVAVYPWPHQVKTGAPECLHRKAWQGLAEQEGLDFIDLYPLFINERPAAEVTAGCFIKDDIHWNEQGHRLVADRLLQYLASGK